MGKIQIKSQLNTSLHPQSTKFRVAMVDVNKNVRQLELSYVAGEMQGGTV